MSVSPAARVKARLAARQRVVMMNPDHPSPSLVEFIARLGVDAVMIDTEQGSPDVETVENMARAARAAGLCALVRIFTPDPWVIERVLFRGVHGLVVPRVDTAAEARRVVADVRYCFPDSFAEKLVVMQIETAGAVAELDDFLAIEEIDAFFVGPVDLAKSFGHGGDFRVPTVMAVLDRTISRIAAAGRSAGMLVTAADVGAWQAKGATLLYNHLNEYALLGAEAFGSAASR
ncbi:MAG: 2,4-dihydroxyhept-2-ene-1,7-dioic acid aldolase [Alphaproteobacteria bacterium]|nr:2,4-dihydroxyhept-2-ene-1,7-dioic acid aldolase [Alphaproteobacteria bacterium]